MTTTLVKSLHALKAALVEIERGGDIGAFRQRVPSGVGASLCEAASTLVAAGEGVEVSVSWALARPAGERCTSLGGVAFSRREADTLREAAKAPSSPRR